MKTQVRVGLLVTLVGLGILWSCGTKNDADFYVSADIGNDAWSGSLAVPNADATDGPLRTLGAAQQAIRQARKSNALSVKGTTVRISGGTYSFAKTLQFDEDDSGTESAAIVWQAAPGETVIFSGGLAVDQFVPVSNPAVLKRFAAEARDHILQADLRALGLNEFAELSEKDGPGLELFFDHQRMQRARYPNAGYLLIDDVPQSGGKLIHEGSWQWQRDDIPVGRHFGRFTFSEAQPAQWQPADDIWLQGYFCWDWRDGLQRVARIDPDDRQIYLAPPYHNYGFSKNQRYFFLNVLEALDQPGEWYLDREKGLLYFWPPKSLTDGPAQVSLLRGPLVALRNARHLRFENITFELSQTNAIEISGGNDNLIAGCTIRNVGVTGIYVDGGKQQGILSSNIYHTGSGAVIMLSGDRPTLTPGNSFVDNCHIYDIGQVRKTACRAVDVHGVGNRVAHNLIHDAPDAGIFYGGNEMVVEFNEIHSIAKESDDVGATYYGRDYTMRGNVVRYNYFHHLEKPMHVGVMAVYLDDFASAATIYGNIFYKAGRAVFMGGGRSHTIENNIFIESTPSVFLDARGLVRNTEYFDGRLTTLVDRMKAMNYRQPPFSTAYPELLTLYDDDPARPKYNRILRNISVGGRWLDLYSGLDLDLLEITGNLIADPVLFRTSEETGVETEHFAEWDRGHEATVQQFVQRGNEIISGDPGFVDAANADFRLREDSPALQLGFKPIPVEKIGLYKDRYRRDLKN